MEKKGTQRIVGVLVIIALVVILLPLLFGKNEPQTQQIVAKAPAFPDQPQQPTSLAANDSEGSSDSTTSSEISVPVPNLPVPNTVASAAEPAKASEASAVTLGAATASASPKSNPAASSQQAAASSSAEKPILNDSTLTTTASSEPQAKVTSPAIETAGKLAANTSAVSANSSTMNPAVASTPTASSDAPLATHLTTAMHKSKAIPAVIKSKRKIVKAAVVKTAQFKQSAWAIQMGNFKNKENAVRLTDQLRAAGFKAFTRDYKLSSGKGVRTRVFIGPEFKQTTAVALSGKVQDKLKIHGIVVSFKPLEL